MNPTRKYDAIFIFPPADVPEAWKEEEKKVEEMISRFGGRTLDRQDWGRRLLGYSLKKNKEGRVLLWNFEMETSRLGEFRKALQLDEKILKTTIFKTRTPKPLKDSEKRKKEKKEEIHARQS